MKSILWCCESCVTFAHDNLKLSLPKHMIIDKVNAKIQSVIKLIKDVKAAMKEFNNDLRRQTGYFFTITQQC